MKFYTTKNLGLSFAGLCLLLSGAPGCSDEGSGGEKPGGDGDDAAPSCATGQTECPLGCAELPSDPMNCGACGNQCETGRVCSGGTCVASCPGSETQCGASCANLMTSPSHCGACSSACSAGETCQAGSCIALGSGGSASGAGGGGGAGTGGSSASGGAVGTGGDATTGGASNTGGSTPVMVGPCDNTVGACSAPEVRVVEIDFGVPITSYGSEWDTAPLPAALAALPGGGTRVAALGTDGQIHVATLDCQDQLVGQPFALPAVDLQDIHSDDEGGVVLLTRDATGSGEDNCGAGPLCGGTSAPCYNSLLVRFDNAGNELWATPVTNLDGDMEGYDNGARFVWGHYQHHGRIASDGENYAAYFCIGITVDNNACVDIHEGDRFEVIGHDGQDVAHPQEMAVGCSHSWTTRTVFDPRTNEFMMTCATDNPDPETGAPCRIRHAPTNTTIAPVECAGEFWQGDLVLAEGEGYWSAYSQAGAVNLVHFTEEGPDNELTNVASSDHAKLIRYSASKMLLAWEDGDQMAARILDASSGAPLGEEFSIAAEDHAYHAFKEFPDGSVAYPAAGSTNTTLRVARVMPCE